jgi:hypothetical protein
MEERLPRMSPVGRDSGDDELKGPASVIPELGEAECIPP